MTNFSIQSGLATRLMGTIKRALTGLGLFAVSLVVGGAAVVQSAHPPQPPWWDISNWIIWFHRDPQSAAILVAGAIGSGGGFALTIFQVWFSRSAREAEARQIARAETLERNLVGHLSEVQATQHSVSLAIQDLPDQVARNVLEAFTKRQRDLKIAEGEGRQLSKSLPPKPLRCFGRAHDIEELVTHLTEDRTPVAAIIHGGAGLGKSTLACEVAYRAEIAAKYDDRILYIQLERITATRELLDAISRAFNAKPAVYLGEAMSLSEAKPSLLILDNLESLWQSDPTGCEAQLKSLERFSPNTALLVTFRGSDLPAAPRWTLRQSPPPFGEEVARELFLDIAPGINRNDPLLGDFLEELGGMPLAIELVALEAAPFDRLDRTWARWKQVGAAIAKRRHSSEERTTSLEYSIELSLGSSYRNPGAIDALSAISLLHNGIDEIIANEILGAHFYEALRDLISCGLGFRKGNRIDVLPPIRRYVLDVYGFSEEIVGKLVEAYSSLALSLVKAGSGSWPALEAALHAEGENFKALAMYTASRVPQRNFLDLAQKTVGYYRKNLEQTPLTNTAHADHIRLLHSFGLVLRYFQHKSIQDNNIKEYILSSYLALCFADLEMRFTAAHYDRMFLQLEDIRKDSSAELCLEIDKAVEEIKDLYRQNIQPALDSTTPNECWAETLNLWAVDDEQIRRDERYEQYREEFREVVALSKEKLQVTQCEEGDELDDEQLIELIERCAPSEAKDKSTIEIQQRD